MTTFLPRSPHADQMKDALFATLAAAPYGELFPYAALSEIVGADIRQVRWIVPPVKRRLELEASRTLRTEKQIGYRVAEPRDHVDLSTRQHRSGRRKLQTAIRILTATPLAQLTPEERKRHDAWLTVYQGHLDVLRSVKRKAEAAQATVSRALQEEIDDALSRIRALEQRGTPP